MPDTTKLTRLTAELEGLLHVLALRDNENIRAQVKEKYNELNQNFQSFMAELEKIEPTPAATHMVEDAVRTLTNDEVKDQEAVSSEVEDEMDAAVAAIEKNPEADEEIVPIILEETQEPEADNDILQDDEDQPDDRLFNPEEDTRPDNNFRYVEPEVSSELSVDEMLSRKEATDLKRVFTLNDKFRFRRQLFNQNDSLFSEVLEKLAVQPTFEEARKLMLEQYGWNLSDPDVDDFMSIIKPHYPA